MVSTRSPSYPPSTSTGGITQDQLNSQISAIQSQITAAQSTATAAQTAAGNAQNTATNAQSAATTAQSKANDVQTQANALQTSMPVASSTLPPAVLNASAIGTAAMFARADHTHSSSGQTTRLPVSGTGGTITWTFPIAYSSAPFVVATCECASGASTPYVVNLVGQPTTTSVTLAIFKTAPVTLPSLATSLLGYMVNVFSIAPAGIYVNILARASTP